LRERGLDAQPIRTEFEGELDGRDEAVESSVAENSAEESSS
jgi:hypothetical protein